MKKTKQILVLLFIFIILNPILTCYANSAQAPSIIFVVNNPPKGLSLQLDKMEARVGSEFGEMYFAFYNWSYKENEKHFLNANWKDKDITIEIPPLRGYQKVYTLDLKNETIIDGKIPSYTFFRGIVRLMITLAIEGIIFWFWNFRKKSSWVYFFVINIITQFFLGFYLNSKTPFDSYMAVFELAFLEIMIFSVEMFFFGILIKENSGWSRVFYALSANLASLIIGSVVLSFLV